MSEIIRIETEALNISEQCQGVKIVDQETYDEAVGLRGLAKDFLSRAMGFFETMRKPAWDSYQAVMAQRGKVVDPTERDIKFLDSEIGRWDREQKRIAEEHRRAAEAEARRQAEEERLAQAVAAEAQGADEESVATILAAPVVVASPVVVPTYVKSSDVVVKDNWDAEVTDLLALVKYVAKNKQFINLLQVNQTALRQLAKAQKESLAIPGVQVVNKAVVASRARRS